MKHRKFNADHFLEKFQGHESLLGKFVKIWPKGLQVNASSLDVPGFRRFILTGTGTSKDQFFEELYRVYDLCTEEGHEDLLAACREIRPRYDPDPQGDLPVECLA